MKKLYFLCLVFFTTILAANAQLSGNYTIGAGKDYETFAAAVSALNTNGLDGDVVFQFTEASISNLTSSITIGKSGGIVGGTTYSVLFESVAVEGKTIIPTTYTNSSTPSILIMDMKNLTFKNLEFVKSATYKLIELRKGSIYSDHITFDSCTFSYTTTTVNSHYAIYAATTNYTQNLVVTNCNFRNCYYGINIIGTDALSASGMEISNNVFTNTYNAINLTYANGAEIKNNSSDSCNNAFVYLTNCAEVIVNHNQIRSNLSTVSTLYGIYLEKSPSATITNNTIDFSNINTASNLYGVMLKDVQNTEEKHGLIANNIISMEGSNLASTTFGIYIYASSTTYYLNYYDVYYNTVYIESITKQTASCAYKNYAASTSAIYQGNNHNVKNNIWINRAGGYSVYVNCTKANLVSANWDWNHNIYYSNAKNNIFYMAANITAETGYSDGLINDKDTNSLFANVLLNLEWEPEKSEYNNLGISINNLTQDINGTSRSAVPDIGAVEWTAASSDLSLTQLSACGDSLYVILSNSGEVKLLSSNMVTLAYTINGSSEYTKQWSGTLDARYHSEIVLCAHDLFNFETNQDVKVWIKSITNGSYTDGRHSNDTIFDTSFQPSLSGKYKIGASQNFETIEAAVSAMNALGICGDVVFELTDNAYTETALTVFGSTTQGILGNYEGNYSITFQAAQGVTPIVTAPGNTGHWFTVNGVKNVTFKGLTFDATVISGNYSIFYLATTVLNFKTVSNWKFENCNFVKGAVNNLANSCIYGMANAKVSDFTVDSCSFSGGYAGIYVIGVSALTNLNVLYSSFINHYSYGIYLTTAGINCCISNNHFGLTGTAYTYGIKLDNAHYSIINNNWIERMGTAAINISGSNAQIINNRISKSSKGIQVVATSASPIIRGNILDSCNTASIELNTSHNAIIDSNIITNNAYNATMAYGIYLTLTYSNSPTIINNKIIYTNLSSGTNLYGIYIYGGSGTTLYGEIANNIVSIKGSAIPANSYGLYFYNNSSTSLTNYFNIYHNTIYLESESIGTASSAFYNYSITSTAANQGRYKNIKNNIFINKAGGYCVYVRYAVTSSYWDVDYNIYYSNAATNIAYVVANKTAFGTGWFGTNSDVNSIYGDPELNVEWIPSTAINLASYMDKAAALSDLNVSNLSQDILTQTRNALHPDGGAIEWSITATTDVSLSYLQTPCGLLKSQTLYGKIKNNGTNQVTVTNSEINYYINNVSQTVTGSWNLTLNSGEESDLLEIGTITPITGSQVVLITISHTGDEVATNDSCQYTKTARLSGLYSIGSGKDFETITAANTALSDYGICGDVVFKIYDDFSMGTTVLNTGRSNSPYGIEGSPEYAITFESADVENPVTVTTAATPNSWNIYGVSNLHFKNLNIQNTVATTTKEYTFYLQSAACRNLSFTGCSFVRKALATPTTTYSIYASPEAQADGISIINNTFYHAGCAIYLSGASGSLIKNPVIKGNTFYDQSQYGLYLFYVGSAFVDSNFVTKQSSTDYYLTTALKHLFSFNYSSGLKVSRNRLIVPNILQANSYEFYGMNFKYCSNTDFKQNDIINNLIVLSGSLPTDARECCGIYIDADSRNVQLCHNTIVLRPDVQIVRSNPVSVFRSMATTGYHTIKNNIFECLSETDNLKYEYGYATDMLPDNTTICDYNIYYSSKAAGLLYDGSRAFSTVEEYSNMISSKNDIHSLYLNPKILDDYTPNENRIDNAGSPCALVTDDIYGKTRSLSTPDAGAVEWSVAKYDAGIFEFLPICNSEKNIKIKIKNYGIDTLMSFKVQYQVDGDTIRTVSYTNYSLGSESITDYITITDDNITALNGGDAYTVKIWTSLPNANSDNQPLNDTLTYDGNIQLSGEYTVGSSGDFETFEEVVNALNNYGQCGDVVFKLISNLSVGSTLYTLGKALYPCGVIGNDMYSITFTSNNEAEPYTINTTVGSSSSNYFLALNSIKNITFKHINFTATNNMKFFMLQGSEHTQNVTFDSCTFTFPSSSSNYQYGIYAAAANYTKNLTVKNCTFTRGYYHVYISGTEQQNSNIQITKNHFTGISTSAECVNLTNPVDPIIKQNDFTTAAECVNLTNPVDPIIKQNDFTTAKYGVYINVSTNATIDSNSFSSVINSIYFAGTNSKAFVDYNTINSGTNGIYFTAMSDSCTVKNNDIESVTNGIYFAAASTSTFVIDSNNIRMTTLGIYISGGTYAKITSNYIYSTATSAITLSSGSYHQIKNNRIVKVTGATAGSYMTSSGTTSVIAAIRLLSTADYHCIVDNMIDSVYATAIYIYLSNYDTISGNTITNNGYYYAGIKNVIWIHSYSTNSKNLNISIIGNRILYNYVDANGLNAIAFTTFSSSYYSVTANPLIVNNIIRIQGSALLNTVNSSIIALYNYGNADIYHNTLIMESTTAAPNSVIIQENGTATRLTYTLIKNNILVNHAGGQVLILPAATGNESDYNAYYSTTSTTLATIAATSCSDLASMQNKLTISNDVNSVYGAPIFVANSHLLLDSANYIPGNSDYLNGLDLTSTVSVDIDSNIRYNPPARGALEWTSSNYDVAVTSISNICTNDSVIDITFTNCGIEKLTSAKIALQINDETPIIIQWTAASLLEELAQNESYTLNYTISNYYFQPSSTTYKFKVWGYDPSGHTDENARNDTLNQNKMIPLNGLYTVGGTNPVFATVGSAITALNTAGICGSVIMELRTGTYSEYELTLNKIAGADSANTITFRSADSNPDTTKLETSNGTILTMTASTYVYFEKLGFSYTGVSSIPLISLASSEDGDPHHIGFDSCVFSSNYGMITNASSTVKLSYLKIHNCQFTASSSGSYGINITGSTSYRPYHISVTKNSFSNIQHQAVSVAYADTLTIDSNVIAYNSAKLTSSSTAFIQLSYCKDSLRISNNKIEAVFANSGTYTPRGLYMLQCQPTSTNDSGFVYNNIINYEGYLTTASPFTYLIQIGTNTSRQKINHNTLITQNTKLEGSSSSLLFTVSSVTGNEIKNNIMAALTPSIGAMAAYYTTTGNTIDYNVYYTTATNTVYNGGIISNSTDLAIKEPSSLIVNPSFTSLYKPQNTSIEGKGCYTGIRKDYYGSARKLATPDAGAIEWDRKAYDIAMYEVETCVTHGDSLRVKLQNFGYQTITSATIIVEVNDDTVAHYLWSGSLPEEAVSDYFGVMKDTFSIGNNMNLKVKVSNPNGQIDEENSNDSIIHNYLNLALKGRYTVGGINPDFSTPIDAVEALYQYGVCGAVIMDIRKGNYSGQLHIQRIAGTSAENTVTFKSENGHCEDVVLERYITKKGGDVDSNAVILFDSVDYVIIKQISIKTSISDGIASGSYIWRTNSIQFKSPLSSGSSKSGRGDCNYITIDSCYVESPVSNTTTSAIRGICAYHATNANILISNNTILNGNHGIYYAADMNASLASSNIVIRNNTVINPHDGGIDLQNYINGEMTVDHNTIIINSSYTGSYGMAFSLGNIDGGATKKVLNNRIEACGKIQCGILASASSFRANTTYRGLIANNAIHINTSNTTVYGIFDGYNNSYLDYYHNTVVIESAGLTSYAFYQEKGSHYSVIKNNILVNLASGYAIGMLKNGGQSPTPSGIDYNLYYSNGTYVGKNGLTGSDVDVDYSAWITASGETNSLNQLPDFSVDYVNLHLNTNITGTTVDSVATDRDGIFRNDEMPSMGAYEYQSGYTGDSSETVLLLGPDSISVPAISVQFRVSLPDTSTVVWSYPASWTLVSGSDSTVITFNLSADAEMGEICAENQSYCIPIKICKTINASTLCIAPVVNLSYNSTDMCADDSIVKVSVLYQGASGCSNWEAAWQNLEGYYYNGIDFTELDTTYITDDSLSLKKNTDYKVIVRCSDKKTCISEVQTVKVVPGFTSPTSLLVSPSVSADTNHLMALSWSGSTGTGVTYQLQYSADSSNWSSVTLSPSDTTKATVNMHENPNKAYWFRVRSVNSNDITCIWNTVKAYTAVDAPERAGITIDPCMVLTVSQETPQVNPEYTQYAIKMSDTSYVQIDGTVASTPIWQTRTQWGATTSTGAFTLNIYGLLKSTTYNVTVLARNEDKVVSQSKYIIAEGDNMNSDFEAAIQLLNTYDGYGNILYTSQVSSQFNNQGNTYPDYYYPWWTPYSSTNGAWQYGTDNDNGYVYFDNTIGYITFLRSPEMNLADMSYLYVTFDLKNDSVPSSGYIDFNMYCQTSGGTGTYYNPMIEVNSATAVSRGKISLSKSSDWRTITLKINLSSIPSDRLGRSILYINSKASNSGTYKVKIDNIAVQKIPSAVSATTGSDDCELPTCHASITPSSVTFVCPNESVNFTATTEGNAISYTWQDSVNNVINTEGYLNDSSAVFTADTSGRYYIRCIVEADCGTDTTNWTAISIAECQEINADICLTETYTYRDSSVTPDSAKLYHYQWLYQEAVKDTIYSVNLTVHPIYKDTLKLGNELKENAYVGSGTSSQAATFAYSYASHTYTQQIYLNSELMGTETGHGQLSASNNNITQITVKIGQTNTSIANNNTQITLYMGHTSNSQFPANKAFIPYADMTQVCDTTFKITQQEGDSIVLMLNTPFTYDVTKNLVLGVEYQGTAYQGSGTANRPLKYIYTTASSRVCITTSPGTLSTLQYGSSVLDSRVNIRLATGSGAVDTTASPIMDTLQICSGTSYVIDADHTVSEAGLYPVMMQSLWGCDSVVNYIVQTMDAPEIQEDDFTLTTTEDTVLHLVTSMEGAWSSSNTSVAVINKNTGVVTPASSGNVTFYYKVGNCCQDSVNVTISSPLPIELISLSGYCKDNKTQIHWITATETNNAFFTVEYSDDAVYYRKIAQIEGAGNSNSPQIYTYEDDKFISEVNYYRLNQTDYNGDVVYFSPIVVMCQSDIEHPFVLIYPNPVNEELQIEFAGMILNKIEIVDVYGRIVLTRDNLNLSSKLWLNVADLSKGSYFLNLYSKKVKLISKFIKQ